MVNATKFSAPYIAATTSEEIIELVLVQIILCYMNQGTIK
jgi:hypothetical protein